MNFTLFFGIFSVVMTTFLGGMLVWLHFRLGELKSSTKQLPLLEEKFTKTLMGARREMQALEKFATEKLPGMDEKITAARQAIDEIDYMLTKTEKSMTSAEELLGNLKEASPTSATVETVQTSPVQDATASVPQTVENKPTPTLPNLESAMTSPKPAKIPAPRPIQQQAYQASAQLTEEKPSQTEQANTYQSRKPQIARESDGTPTYASESISRAEMANRNRQSSAEQSLRDSLAEILK